VPQFDQEKSLTDEGKYLLIQKLVNSIYHSYGDLTEVGQYLDDLLVGTQEPEQRTHLEFLFLLMKSENDV